jgi:hypothetical protein
MGPAQQKGGSKSSCLPTGHFDSKPWKGRRRAAFRRELGFPNLARARAAKARKREERLKRETFERARALNPFALKDDCAYLVETISKTRKRRRV